jgi:hypothetical protein
MRRIPPVCRHGKVVAKIAGQNLIERLEQTAIS